eukprot:1158749-Pelagomonas_calceolata.AAC.3
MRRAVPASACQRHNDVKNMNQHIVGDSEAFPNASLIIADFQCTSLLLPIPNASLMIANSCVQVSEAFPNALGILVTAGGEGAAYCFRSPSKGEHSGYIPSFEASALWLFPASSARCWPALRHSYAGSLDALAADATKLKEAIVFASATGKVYELHEDLMPRLNKRLGSFRACSLLLVTVGFVPSAYA